MGAPHFLKRQERAERLASFCAEHSGDFSSVLRFEECSTSGKMQCSSLSPYGQLWSGLIPTKCHTLFLLRLNGEVNIACLRVFMSLLDGIAGLP